MRAGWVERPPAVPAPPWDDRHPPGGLDCADARHQDQQRLKPQVGPSEPEGPATDERSHQGQSQGSADGHQQRPPTGRARQDDDGQAQQDHPEHVQDPADPANVGNGQHGGVRLVRVGEARCDKAPQSVPHEGDQRADASAGCELPIPERSLAHRVLRDHEDHNVGQGHTAGHDGGAGPGSRGHAGGSGGRRPAAAVGPARRSVGVLNRQATAIPP